MRVENRSNPRWLLDVLTGRFNAPLPTGSVFVLYILPILLVWLLAVLPFQLITHPWSRQVFVDSLTPVYALAASVLLFISGRKSLVNSRRTGQAWQVLGLAGFFAALGEIAWSIIRSVLHQNPYPSVADVFYLVSFPLFLIGILVMPVKRASLIEQIIKFLEIVILTLSTILFLWIFVLTPLFLQTNPNNPLLVIFSFIYPVFELLALFGLLTLGFRNTETLSYRPLLFLGIGGAIRIISDILFSYQGLQGSIQVTGLPDIISMASYIIWGFAGFYQYFNQPIGPKIELTNRPPSPNRQVWLRTALPPLAIFAAYILLVGARQKASAANFYDLAFCIAILIGLTILVQILYAVHNSRLNRALVSLNEELESRVSERTHLLGDTVDALRRNESMFRGVIEQALDGIALTNEAGILIEWNRVMEEITALPADHLLGKPVSEVLTQLIAEDRRTPEFRQSIEGFVQQALATGQGPWLGHIMDYEHSEANGASRFLQVMAFPIKTELGYMIGNIGRDITALKHTEAALKIKDNAIRTSISAIVITDASGIVTYVNSSFLRMWGYESESRIIGTDTVQLWSNPQLAQEVIEKIRTHGQWIGEGEARRKDGSKFDVQLTGHLVTDENGTPVAMMGSFVDITERKRAEEILRLNEVRLHSLLALSQKVSSLSEKEIIESALDEVILLTGSSIGYCNYIDADKQTIERTIWDQETMKTCTAKLEPHYPLAVAGVWAEAARFKAPVIHNDYLGLEWKQGLPEGHIPIQKLMSVPVMEDGRVLILIGVGNKKTDYDASDLHQLQLVANDTWLMICRKHTEEALHQALLIVENSPVMYFRWKTDKGWPVELVSQNITQLGYTPDEFLSGSRLYASIIHPTDLDRVAQEVEDYFTYGIDRFQQEYRIVTPDGKIRWLYNQTSTERDAQGKILGYQGIVIDITERKLMEQMLEEMAAVDFLTGLYNRRQFFNRFEFEFNRVQRSGPPLSLLMLDIDNFKTINDTYGHAAGDITLRSLALQIRQLLREIDLVARIGGDEFAVLLPYTSLDDALVVANRLLSYISRLMLVSGEDKFRVTASIGAATFNSSMTDVDALMKQADLALYQAKKAGRNSVIPYQA